MSDFSTVPVSHESPDSAVAAYKHFVDRTTSEERRWMGVMFVVNDAGRLVVHRTTCNFPKADIENAIEELRKLMEAELVPVATAPAELPLAARFRRGV